MPAIDKFQLTTDKLIELLKQGVKPWEKPWHTQGIGYGNLISEHKYRGINPLLCAIDVLTHSYTSPHFVGFKQATDRGWTIRKGSKSTWLRWGGVSSKEVETEDGETKEQRFRCVKWMQVFNIDCINDADSEDKIAHYLKPLPILNTQPRSVDVDAFITAQQVPIKHLGKIAAYYPEIDQITLPQYELFSSHDFYYGTAVHELIHATGHSSRCKRNLSSRPGSAGYAFEELIAEIGAAFVCQELGITSTLEHHASYLDSWLKVLGEDNKAFLKAAIAAQQAAGFLLAKAGMLGGNSTIAA